MRTHELFERMEAMKEIALLAAVDANWGIGYQNQLLFHLKKDMEYFRKLTLKNIVVMGRKTFVSLPGARPLPERKNIVLTRQKGWEEACAKNEEEVIVFHSIDQVLAYVDGQGEDVYIIGGGEVYRQFLGCASMAFITKVKARKQADTFFPHLDQIEGWNKVYESEMFIDESGIEFQFLQYCHIGADSR